MFAVVSTILAIASHHFIFGAMPSLGARAVVAAGLFGAALPVAARPVSAGRWLAVVFGGQAVACWWLHQASGGLAAVPRDDWFLVPIHAHQSHVVGQLVLTLLMAFMLHGADSACRRLLLHVGRELRVVRRNLWRILCPVAARNAPALPQTHLPQSPGPVRGSPLSTLLADAVVRRGPPSRPPLAV
jgi:hypothetical protein